MSSSLFVKPVYVRDNHVFEEIRGLDDAIAFLESWSDEKQDLAYDVVLTALYSAARGELPIRTVEVDFHRLIKRAGMIAEAEEVSALIAAVRSNCRGLSIERRRTAVFLQSDSGLPFLRPHCGSMAQGSCPCVMSVAQMPAILLQRAYGHVGVAILMLNSTSAEDGAGSSGNDTLSARSSSPRHRPWTSGRMEHN